MPRHGENIYKRRDGRYEGRYVIGKTSIGKTRFGYIYGYQYAAVRNQLLQKKAEQLKKQNDSITDCTLLLRQYRTNPDKRHQSLLSFVLSLRLT